MLKQCEVKESTPKFEAGVGLFNGYLRGLQLNSNKGWSPFHLIHCVLLESLTKQEVSIKGPFKTLAVMLWHKGGQCLFGH